MIILHSLSLLATAQLNCLSANGGTSITTCDTGLPTAAASGSQLHIFLQIVLAIFAVIAVLMIVIEALNIVNSEGDSQKVAKARSSIIYALVGLVIAILAEAIVTFVVGRF